ncbi:hypothetical protein L596_011088 [Steinernema carpocapsae]|uniref:Uncharacterized protein n=1 Tax=Steinernema carpocapsae TaxID=34508 RepID=A0A4U5NT89_STECR|nr:hypothetical protein L596_011088 [Steinernema carpocapsae]
MGLSNVQSTDKNLDFRLSSVLLIFCHFCPVFSRSTCFPGPENFLLSAPTYYPISPLSLNASLSHLPPNRFPPNA